MTAPDPVGAAARNAVALHPCTIGGPGTWLTATPAPMSESPPTHDPPPASFLQIVRAVLWSFFGVRKQRMLQQDIATIKPLHIVVAGVIGGLVFVLTLILIVRLILANA